MGNFREISEKYLGNKREKPGTGHRSTRMRAHAMADSYMQRDPVPSIVNLVMKVT